MAEKKKNDEADETPAQRSCATDRVHERLLREDPAYASRRAACEDQAWRAAHAATYAMPTLRTGCTEIPVVVHVVHRTNAENISDAQIASQIEVLNQDFRGTNADASTIPAPFAPLATDARIQFALATTDPDGNPTDGITRTRTNVNGFSSDDDVKFEASGGHDAWPSEQYLNIWVCQLAGGLLGYAQFPGGPSATDGVVVRHSAFGTTGTAQAPFNLGRTTTHEIGHWLNLRHIWGDDGQGCSGSDFVGDTPNQAGPNTGKPNFPHVSCSNGPNGDMFMNYMDYVDDDTMTMFSAAQVVRMHATLDGMRSGIGRSVPCGGPVVVPPPPCVPPPCIPPPPCLPCIPPPCPPCGPPPPCPPCVPPPPCLPCVPPPCLPCIPPPCPPCVPPPCPCGPCIPPPCPCGPGWPPQPCPPGPCVIDPPTPPKPCVIDPPLPPKPCIIGPPLPPKPCVVGPCIIDPPLPPKPCVGPCIIGPNPPEPCVIGPNPPEPCIVGPKPPEPCVGPCIIGPKPPEPCIVGPRPPLFGRADDYSAYYGYPGYYSYPSYDYRSYPASYGYGTSYGYDTGYGYGADQRSSYGYGSGYSQYPYGYGYRYGY